MHPFAITADGSMYIDVGTATNSCQLKNRTLKSPGADPCTELETRGGTWRYDANKTNQPFTPGDRFATGIRNGEGFAIDASGRVFVTQHGRDQLRSNWPRACINLRRKRRCRQKSCCSFGRAATMVGRSATTTRPAAQAGACSGIRRGRRKACRRLRQQDSSRCSLSSALGAENGAVYDQKQFPAHYHNGVFIAFHGSWDRAPFAQAGYNVVFQSLCRHHASGGCEIFADGFAGGVKSPENAVHRPSGLAVGPDGALYIAAMTFEANLPGCV